MPHKTAPGSPAPAPRGVAGHPGGLSAGAWRGAVAGLVVFFGLLFWLAAEPFTAAMARWDVPRAPEPPPEIAVAAPVPASPERVEEPREPAWTLADVEGAVSALGPQIQNLIDAGRTELPEFKALDSRDATRAARARERFTAWARIWRNRVGQLTGQLPPPEACGVHAAMDPACFQLREILGELHDVADAETLDVAEARLEGAATGLDLFLNPPEPEPEPEEDGEDAGGDGDTKQSADEVT
ncbi:MAG: hypothetical protein AAGM22_17495 [Acidobacteriota bacterium]